MKFCCHKYRIKRAFQEKKVKGETVKFWGKEQPTNEGFEKFLPTEEQLPLFCFQEADTASEML